jgi:hypothetical protein
MVQPATARRVQKVIDEVGSYPNIHARAMVSGRSQIFGLVISEMTNPLFPEIAQTFADLAVEHKYEVLPGHSQLGSGAPDHHYCTIPDRQSRGLVGHSMGGYGATRIGMKHSDVFGSLYIMSPCCLSPRPPVNPELAKSLEAVKTLADCASLPFFARATLASAAAWSPNPKNPPPYLDLATKQGAPQPDVLAKWAANAPLALIDQYIGSLRQYRAISIDVGDQDGLRVDAAKLHEALDDYGITNSFEVYSGTHTSKVAERFQNHVLPFFSQNLCFQAMTSIMNKCLSVRCTQHLSSSSQKKAPCTVAMYKIRPANIVAAFYLSRSVYSPGSQ